MFVRFLLRSFLFEKYFLRIFCYASIVITLIQNRMSIRFRNCSIRFRNCLIKTKKTSSAIYAIYSQLHTFQLYSSNKFRTFLISQKYPNGYYALISHFIKYDNVLFHHCSLCTPLKHCSVAAEIKFVQIFHESLRCQQSSMLILFEYIMCHYIYITCWSFIRRLQCVNRRWFYEFTDGFAHR